jgi:hypothetical protein
MRIRDAASRCLTVCCGRVETGDRIGVPGLKCSRETVQEEFGERIMQLREYRNAIRYCNTHVERGDALQLGEKCGPDGQVLVGLLYAPANMLTLFMSSNYRMTNYELERI